MDICEVVTSIRNKSKINVHGYLMIKDKNRKNRYYWSCEKRYALRCNGRATTFIIFHISLIFYFSSLKVKSY